jgi:hypothetical protein
VVYFVDRALSTFMSDAAGEFVGGLDETESRLRNVHPGVASLGELDHEDRIAFVRTIEETPFFELLWTLTAMGMFSHPSYGGNRDERIGHPAQPGPSLRLRQDQGDSYEKIAL